MPATIVGADSAVESGVLVAVDGVKPGAADGGGVEEEVDFLAVVEGLGVEVTVSFLLVRGARLWGEGLGSLGKGYLE